VLDVVGPLEVFSRASRLITDEGRSGAPVYDVEILGTSRSPLVMSSGIRLCPDRAYREVRRGIDTLLVAGGRGTERFLSDAGVLRWLRKQSRSVRRVGSICTGAFVLAEAGLLDGLRATTHWASCEAFAARYPGVSVDPDPIFVRQGPIWTSAGVTAGMDLALAMVEEDHGRDAALEVAKALVLFLRRPGGQ
jgi:transcriptional regulator GlxA family with amidase domain